MFFVYLLLLDNTDVTYNIIGKLEVSQMTVNILKYFTTISMGRASTTMVIS